MRRQWGRFVVLVSVVVALGGCAVISAQRATRSKLRNVGYDTAVSIDETNGYTTAEVIFKTLPGDPEAAAQAAACIVWTTMPYKIDEIDIVGELSDRFDRNDLLSACGPRPAGYDDQTIGSSFARIGKGVAIGVGVGCLALVVGAIVLVVLLVRRSRRRRSDPPPPPPGYGGYPPGAGYPPSGAGYPPPPTPYGQPPAWGSSPPAGPTAWGAPPPASPPPSPETGPWGPPPA